MRTWLRRQRYLIDYTVSCLLRRRGKNLGLLFVYTLVIFTLASVMLYSHALKREAAQLLAGAPEVVVQRLVAGRHDLMPADYLDRLGQLRGVARIEPRLWGYYYDPAIAANYTLMAPLQEPIAPGRVVLGAGVARSRGLAPGDILSLPGYDGRPHAFTVDRVLPSESELVSADLLLVSEADFRALFGLPAKVYTDLALSVTNPGEARKVAEKIALRLPDCRPILREEVLRTYEAVFNWREGLLLVVFTGALLAFVIFAWDKAAGLSAEEQREIGILKALGWETADVLLMKFWEGALLSLLAFCLGYVAAHLHVFYLGAPLIEGVLKGWSVLYPQFRLAPQVDALQLVSLLLLSVLPYTAATLIPVWRAASTDPDSVMR